MLSKIEYSKPYKLQLLRLYGSTVYKCFVIGETNINNVANNQDDYNIYDTFFAPFGYGLGSYYSAILPTTKIYICNIIESFDPLTVKRDEKIFIPSSLIDMDNSYEYVECSNINFTIYPVIKKFNSVDEQTNYINDLVIKMKKKLGELVDFSILTNEIENFVTPMYITKEEIDDIEKRRSEMFNEHIQRQQNTIRYRNEQEETYNRALYELKAEKEKYQIKNEELTNTKNRLEIAIKEYERLTKDELERT